MTSFNNIQNINFKKYFEFDKYFLNDITDIIINYLPEKFFIMYPYSYNRIFEEYRKLSPQEIVNVLDLRKTCYLLLLDFIDRKNIINILEIIRGVNNIVKIDKDGIYYDIDEWNDDDDDYTFTLSVKEDVYKIYDDEAEIVNVKKHVMGNGTILKYYYEYLTKLHLSKHTYGDGEDGCYHACDFGYEHIISLNTYHFGH